MVFVIVLDLVMPLYCSLWNHPLVYFWWGVWCLRWCRLRKLCWPCMIHYLQGLLVCTFLQLFDICRQRIGWWQFLSFSCRWLLRVCHLLIFRFLSRHFLVVRFRVRSGFIVFSCFVSKYENILSVVMSFSLSRWKKNFGIGRWLFEIVYIRSFG